MNTRLERLKSRHEKLINDRRTAMLRNDIYLLTIIDRKVKEVEQQIKEAEEYEPKRLSEYLDNYGEDVKNDIYVKLLKCSLAADYLNDCAEQVKSALREINLHDFSFREDIDTLCKISQRTACIMAVPNQDLLCDTLYDDDEFIESCHTAADKLLGERLSVVRVDTNEQK